MKKLKLQKALLAICLALPIILKISNGTNAMDNGTTTNYWPIKHYLNDNGSKQQKDKYDTYSYQLVEFLRKHKDIKQITVQQHKDFLRQYIRDDITKYQALLIQTKYRLLPKHGIQTEISLSIAKLHYELLASHKLDRYWDDLRSIVRFHLHCIETKQQFKHEMTQEEKLLSLLFIENEDDLSIQGRLDKMREIIPAYEKDRNITKGKTNSYRHTILSSLGPVADQLYLENEYQENNTLEALAHRVKQFSEAYNQKPDQPENKPENNHNETPEEQYDWLIEQNSNNNGPNEPTNQQETFLQTLYEYLREQQIKKPLNKRQTEHLLSKHIGDDIVKYLALRIQIEFKQIPIYKTLYKNLEGTKLNDSDRLYNHIPFYASIRLPQEDLIPYNEKEYQKFKFNQALTDLVHSLNTPTKEVEILHLLLHSRGFTQTPEDALNQLENKIKAYKEDQKTPVDNKHSLLISYLGPVADQLSLESSYIKRRGKRMPLLEQLAQLVREFSEAYKKKHKGDIDIKGIEKLIQKWIKQKDKTNTEKEAKLQKLEQAINSLERKYHATVKGKKVKRKQI